MKRTRHKNTTLLPEYKDTRTYTFDSDHQNYNWEDVEKANFGAFYIGWISSVGNQ